MTLLQKLTPNQDLQCYFYQPSSMAALSATSADRFHRVGFLAHPVGLGSHRMESRQCFRASGIPQPAGQRFQRAAAFLPGDPHKLHSDRLVAVSDRRLALPACVGGSRNRRTGLQDSVVGERHTQPSGSYTPASATFELQGAPTGGDYIELAWDEEHYTYQLYGADTLQSAAAALANSINTFSQTMLASPNGAAITLTLPTPTPGRTATGSACMGILIARRLTRLRRVGSRDGRYLAAAHRQVNGKSIWTSVRLADWITPAPRSPCP